MKTNKIYFIFLIIFFILGFTGCNNDEEDIFEGTATQRMKQKCVEIDSILHSSPDGWFMNYYPDPENLGGYNILMSFSGKETVIMQGDAFFPSGKYSSLYAVEGTQGPVINFNTSNEVLHRLANPELFYPGEGMLGDFEFVWKKTSENRDTLYLKGKKRDFSVELTKFNGNWDEYMNSINTNMTAFSSRFFKQITFANGEKYVIGGYNSINRTSYSITTENSKTVELPDEDDMLTFTKKGVEYYKPLVIGNQKIQHIDYDTVTKKFNIADPGIEGVLDQIDAPLFVFEHAKDSIFDNKTSYRFASLPPELYDIVTSIREKLKTVNANYSALAILYVQGSYRLSILANDGTNTVYGAYMILQFRKNTDRTDKINLFNQNTTIYGDYKTVIANECRALTALIAGTNSTGKNYIVMPNFNYTNFILGACDRDFSFTFYKW